MHFTSLPFGKFITIPCTAASIGVNKLASSALCRDHAHKYLLKIQLAQAFLGYDFI